MKLLLLLWWYNQKKTKTVGNKTKNKTLTWEKLGFNKIRFFGVKIMLKLAMETLYLINNGGY